MPNAYHLDETRARVLLHFYDNTRKEITRYRDLEWKIPSYVLAFFSAIIVVALNVKFARSITEAARVILLLAIFLVTVISLSLLIECHRKQIAQRQRRQWLEIIFKLHTDKEFVVLTPEEVQGLPDHLGRKDQVLPNNSRTEKIDFRSDFWLYTLNFGLAIFLVGSFVFWLIWKLPLSADS